MSNRSCEVSRVIKAVLINKKIDFLQTEYVQKDGGALCLQSM